MRSKVNLLLLTVLLFACGDDNRFPIQWYEPNEVKVKIDPTKENKIATPNGVVVRIPAGSFVTDSDGKPLRDSCTIVLRDLVYLPDMLFSGMGTITTSGGILSTGGMLLLATDTLSHIRFCDTCAVDCYFPRKHAVVPDMNLYELSGGAWQWKDSAEGATFQVGNRFWQGDTALSPDEMDRRRLEYEKSMEYYVFKYNSFGWINCDALLTQFDDRGTLRCKVQSGDSLVVRLIIPELRSIITGHVLGDVVQFDEVPANRSIQLFAFGKRDEAPCYYAKEVVVTDDLVVNIEPVFASVEQIREHADKVCRAPN
ncbi:MAG: hypothetical protein JST38_20415 [Bacteroidetes bacterium]|nr:hypothetical protein [Pseudomonadota bacterium]MBS1943233.1 hypothetical protein [Bacteroidota bacterium]MBS1945142.1 hypothetical protein [Bacteroidota bacterium]